MPLSVYSLLKKPACWLFLSMQIGCQPPSETVPGALSYQQAQQAEQRQLTSQAYDLYRQASLLGYDAAIAPTIRLAKRQATTAQQLPAWFQQLPTASSKAAAAELLGYWDELPLTMREQAVARFKPLGMHHSVTLDGCVAVVQPVLSDQRSVERWQFLSAQWPKQALAGVGLCFAKPLLVDYRALNCSQVGRLQCNSQPLEPLALSINHRLWLLLAGEGGANYQHGLVSAPVNADWGLLSHELSHAMGFLDEYPLSEAVARTVCQPGTLSSNVLFAKEDVQRFAKHFALQQHEITLTEIETCRQIGLAAWRPVAATTNLQHHEYPLPKLYLTVMAQQLRQIELAPIHYLLAMKAKERGDLQRFEQLMLQAVNLGYTPALSQIKSERSLTAR